MARHDPPHRTILPTVTPVHDRLGVGTGQGMHQGVPLLPGRVHLPPGARTPGRAGLPGGHGRPGSPAAWKSWPCCRYPPATTPASSPWPPRSWMPLSPGASALACPSLRMDSLGEELINQIKRVRKTGFTLAPEAGSERLRGGYQQEPERRADRGHRPHGVRHGLEPGEALLHAGPGPPRPRRTSWPSAAWPPWWPVRPKAPGGAGASGRW